MACQRSRRDYLRFGGAAAKARGRSGSPGSPRETSDPVSSSISAMLLKPAEDLRWSDVTPKQLYLRRREFIQAAGMALRGRDRGGSSRPTEARAQGKGAKLPNVKKSGWGQGETLTPYEAVTTYNNFYEFGTDKDDPARNAASLKPRPWTVSIEGQVAKPGKYDIDDLVKPSPLEERIYRLRCVEGWSMVIPWIGFPLRDLLAQVEPTAKAKFVEFTTLMSRRQMSRRSGVRCSTGRTPRACGSTRRCTR